MVKMKKADVTFTVVIIIVVLAFFFFSTPLLANIRDSGNLFFFHVDNERKCSETGKSFSFYQNQIIGLSKDLSNDEFDAVARKELMDLCTQFESCFRKEYAKLEEHCQNKIGDDSVLNEVAFFYLEGDEEKSIIYLQTDKTWFLLAETRLVEMTASDKPGQIFSRDVIYDKSPYDALYYTINGRRYEDGKEARKAWEEYYG